MLHYVCVLYKYLIIKKQQQQEVYKYIPNLYINNKRKKNSLGGPTENKFFDVWKNKTTASILIIFVSFFWNEDEQEVSCSRHVQPAPLSPSSHGVTCEARGGGTIIQR